MPLLRGFTEPTRYAGGFVAIGNFDGVHRGHQQILSVLLSNARQAQVPAVVLTFEPHPVALLRPEQTPPRLTTLERKADLLMHYGVDTVIAYPTDLAMLNLSPEEFVDRIVRRELQARGLVEGPNFCFGRNRAGTIATLRVLCEERQLALEVVTPEQLQSEPGVMVSSSVIREQIKQGNLKLAHELLGHPYQLRGRVVSGAERGRLIGFPTANLAEIETLLPADGVYAGRAEVQGRIYPAAIHIGPNPTFQEQQRKVEVHLLDFQGNLYGQHLTVEILTQIRSVQSFSSRDALVSQLEQDLQQVRKLT